MDSIAIWLESDSEEEYVSPTYFRNIRKAIRDNSNPLEIPDSRFKKLYRLSKEAFLYVLSETEQHYKKSTRLSAVPIILKIAASLRFFAEGGYQTGTGNDFTVGVAQSTLSIILQETVDIFENILCPKFIKTGMSGTEKNEAKLEYYKTGIPGIIGCIDGTHVKILPPIKDIRHLYINRKGFYSLNVMIMCDHKLKIRFIDATYPGSTHDAAIWNISSLKNYLKVQNNTEDNNSRILADSGYPIAPYLITPYRSPEEGSSKAKFNTIHASTRNCVERTIGLLKNRFRCLLGARQLHYSPKKATQITNTCAALHNICIEFGVAYEDDYSEEVEDNYEAADEDNNEPENISGASIRDDILRAMNL